MIQFSISYHDFAGETVGDALDRWARISHYGKYGTPERLLWYICRGRIYEPIVDELLNGPSGSPFLKNALDWYETWVWLYDRHTDNY